MNWNEAIQKMVADEKPPVAKPIRYRHIKSGSVYEIVGEATLQIADEKHDMKRMILYRLRDGERMWARPYDEFMDGRFELAD